MWLPTASHCNNFELHSLHRPPVKLILYVWTDGSLQYGDLLVAHGADSEIVVQPPVSHDQRCRQCGGPGRADHARAHRVRLGRAADLTVLFVAVALVPVVPDDVFDLVADGQKDEEPRDGEHDPDRDHGRQIGVRLLQGVAQGHHHHQAVEAAGLQGYGLDERVRLPEGSRGQCAHHAAAQGQQHCA